MEVIRVEEVYYKDLKLIHYEVMKSLAEAHKKFKGSKDCLVTCEVVEDNVDTELSGRITVEVSNCLFPEKESLQDKLKIGDTVIAIDKLNESPYEWCWFKCDDISQSDFALAKKYMYIDRKVLD